MRPSQATESAGRTLVFKILPAEAWDAASRDGVYPGSTDDARDGFIHLSAAHQLAGTAARHFRGQADLVLVAFDAAALGPALRWEPSRAGDLFPHLYSPLATSLALWTRPLELCQDGVPIVPPDLPPC